MKDTGEKRISGAEGYEWVKALVCSVLAVVLIFLFGVRLIGVDGHSMVPTLQDRDRMLVVNDLLCGEYQRGDVVVLRKEAFREKPIVKRVIATEGESVMIDFSTGSVFVNGELLDEPYIHELTFLDEGMVFPLEVPEGCLFVMGDNRNHSDDSRNPLLGPVDVRYVLGKAVFLVIPGITADTETREFSRVGAIA